MRFQEQVFFTTENTENAENIIKLDAVKELSKKHMAQIFNYLKPTGIELGMLINFNHYPNLQIERVIL